MQILYKFSFILSVTFISHVFASTPTEDKIISELEKWDKTSDELINSDVKPKANRDRLFAYLYNAQKDYFVENENPSNIGDVSLQIINLFYPSYKSDSKDNVRDPIADKVALRYRERFIKEEKGIHPFPYKETADSWKSKEPFIGLTVPSMMPWFLHQTDQFRLPQPPAPNDPFWKDQLNTLKRIMSQATENQKKLILYWAGMQSKGSGDLLNIANKYMADKQIPLSKRMVVRSVLASTFFDAAAANYDSKYAYMVRRPFMIDPELKTVIPTPNHPSYPAGHSVASSAGMTILSYYFPENKDEWQRQAKECSLSRLWAGVHFPIDIDKGIVLGEEVANFALQQSNSTIAFDDINSTTQPTLKIGKSEKYGKILTDSRGRTLYMYTPDINYTSKCDDEPCSKTWPAYVIQSDRPIPSSEIEGMLGVIKRKDGSYQVIYNGMPLYYYIEDKQPSDIKGQGVNGSWFIINPDTGPIKDERNQIVDRALHRKN